MNGDINQLAVDKLALLYIIEKINLPMSKNQITEIVLDMGILNYFLMQQYLTELINSNFIQYSNTTDRKNLEINEKGRKVLSMFINRIPENTIHIVNNYYSEKKDLIKKDLTIFAEYTIEGNNTFIVNLKALENNSILMDLKINVPSKKQAIQLCEKWKSDPTGIYGKIISTLFED